MKEQTTARQKNGVTFRLWLGLLLPPVAWGMQLQGLYLTSEYGCTSSNFMWNHVVVITALAVSVIGGLIAWREWNASGSGVENEGADQPSRRAFMALLGMLGSLLFTITIVAQWLPTLMGVPCDK